MFGYHKYLAGRFDKKADKEQVSQDFKAVKEDFDEIKGELRYQRDTQAKLFDKLDDLKTIVLERTKK